MRRRAPRSLGSSLERLRGELAPASTLARVQAVWELAVGASIAEHAQPVAERDGILTVACSASVWAAELTMMADEVVARVNAALGDAPPGSELRELRCRTR